MKNSPAPGKGGKAPLPAPPHSHDHIAKFYLGEAKLFADFLENYGDPHLVPLLNLAKLRPETPISVDSGLNERRSDLRYRCEFKGSGRPIEAFIFLEHQSRPQRFITLRILRYIFDAYDQLLETPAKGKKPQLLPYPLAIVLYHGKMPWRSPLAMGELIDMPQGGSRSILDFPLQLVDVGRMDLDNLKGSMMLQSLFAALYATSHGEAEACLPRILGDQLASPRDELFRNRFDAMANYLAGFCESKQSYEVINAAYRQALGVKEGDKMGKSLIEQWMDKGIEKGIEKGRATTLTILATRFGKVPALTEKQIKKCADLDDLNRLTFLAATCESMAEFKRASAEVKSGVKK